MLRWLQELARADEAARGDEAARQQPPPAWAGGTPPVGTWGQDQDHGGAGRQPMASGSLSPTDWEAQPPAQPTGRRGRWEEEEQEEQQEQQEQQQPPAPPLPARPTLRMPTAAGDEHLHHLAHVRDRPRDRVGGSWERRSQNQLRGRPGVPSAGHELAWSVPERDEGPIRVRAQVAAGSRPLRVAESVGGLLGGPGSDRPVI